MLKYAAPILVAGITVINESADKIFLKYLLPKIVSMRELGIYSACYKLTIFINFCSTLSGMQLNAYLTNLINLIQKKYIH